MRVQIIPSKDQKFLRDYYGCRLWKIYEVIRIRKMRTHGNCKLQRTWNEYEIEVRHTYPHNHYGQKTTIFLRDTECKILNPPQE